MHIPVLPLPQSHHPQSALRCHFRRTPAASCAVTLVRIPELDLVEERRFTYEVVKGPLGWSSVHLHAYGSLDLLR